MRPKDYMPSRMGLLPPANSTLIQRVEGKLGIKFPSELKDFLEWADGGILPGGKFIIYSVGKGIHPDETILAANHQRNTPEPLLFIARESEEEFAFKCAEIGKEVCHVYAYSHEEMRLSKISDSFISFVLWAMRQPE